jgi:hypothetical protein
MTCIVGFVDSSKTIWMAGDSIGSNGYTRAIQALPKVAQVGETLIGFTDSFRMGDLLHHSLIKYLPTPKPDQNLDYWMRTTFINAVRHCFAEGGYRKKDNEVESGGTFLVGIRGRLFEINSDFCVTEDTRGYAAIGSSFDLALGAFYVAERMKIDPEEKLILALDAAAAHSALVAPPWTILSLEYSGKVNQVVIER